MNQEAKKIQDGGSTRREFIKKSTLAAVIASTSISCRSFKTPVYGQNQAPAPGRVIGANDRLQIAYIGTGGQGMSHIRQQKNDAAANNVVQTAVCDLSQHRREEAKAFIGSGCELYKDYEKLLERNDIDAVIISTVDHWHCKTAIAALEAGKHVYVEKPMTRYLPEAFHLHDTVKKTGKILQIGSQGCSGAAWHKAAELIQGGRIGPLVWAQGFYCRNNAGGEWNNDIHDWCNPQDLDWDKWQAPVHDHKPFSADSYCRWRKYYPYCAGLLGDLVPHRLVPMMLATGNPEFPARVTCLGTKKVHSDKNTPGTPERDSPEYLELLAEFPSGLVLTIGATTAAGRNPGYVIYGHKASLDISSTGDRLQLTPEKTFSADIDMQTFDGLHPAEDMGAHEKNWFDSIRANRQPNAGIDLAIRAQTVISLAEMSNRENMICRFDEKTRKVKTSDGREIAPITYGTLAPS